MLLAFNIVISQSMLCLLYIHVIDWPFCISVWHISVWHIHVRLRFRWTSDNQAVSENIEINPPNFPNKIKSKCTSQGISNDVLHNLIGLIYTELIKMCLLADTQNKVDHPVWEISLEKNSSPGTHLSHKIKSLGNDPRVTDFYVWECFWYVKFTRLILWKTHQDLNSLKYLSYN